MQSWLPRRSVLHSGQFEWLQDKRTKAVQDSEAGWGRSAVDGSDVWKVLESLHCLYEVQTILPSGCPTLNVDGLWRTAVGHQDLVQSPRCRLLARPRLDMLFKCSLEGGEVSEP